ncbi:hypothetical protein BN7_3260 [Wickerhamomyces ciferrii]|uniref:Uncharacterized protein n=1 Tax=Wickerhamomyces ciferrii (strain ATCC 14091 / BCRC 22168 / CBS 111 / JCM 3599 / NBRC 0793 / NRRL Y-1031 F-60-10) TaxID=1206466 RepID=K0KL34_WICCF|nr:uncharacterized protein BN7_3260 [Wickerhamomyces ciferrii]CCH43706.1 hypothetical protein BN7_3260 [Wickerhamomyces ciferrii]
MTPRRGPKHKFKPKEQLKKPAKSSPVSMEQFTKALNVSTLEYEIEDLFEASDIKISESQNLLDHTFLKKNVISPLLNIPMRDGRFKNNDFYVQNHDFLHLFVKQCVISILSVKGCPRSQVEIDELLDLENNQVRAIVDYLLTKLNMFFFVKANENGTKLILLNNSQSVIMMLLQKYILDISRHVFSVIDNITHKTLLNHDPKYQHLNFNWKLVETLTIDYALENPFLNGNEWIIKKSNDITNYVSIQKTKYPYITIEQSKGPRNELKTENLFENSELNNLSILHKDITSILTKFSSPLFERYNPTGDQLVIENINAHDIKFIMEMTKLHYDEELFFRILPKRSDEDEDDDLYFETTDEDILM